MSPKNDSNENDASFPSTPARTLMPDWYPDMLASVSGKVSAGRIRAVTAVNQELVATYWAIGNDLLEREASDGWGSKVVGRLAADLREQFPDTHGISAT